MKYTKAERLDIGRKIYYGEISRYEAAEKYDIHPMTARDYMRMYRDINNLPPKHGGTKQIVSYKSPISNTLDDYETMTKDELIRELVKARITEARLKKGYEVKGDGADKEYILYDSKNIK